MLNVIVSTNSRLLRSSMSSKRRLPFPKFRGWNMNLSSSRSPAPRSARTTSPLPVIVMSLPGWRFSSAISFFLEA